MACGCEDAAPIVPWEVFNVDAPNVIPAALYHVVLLCGGVVNAGPLIMEIGRQVKGDTSMSLTVVDTSAERRWAGAAKKVGAGYISLPSETNVPRALNIGASRLSRSPYLIFLHDDITLPANEDWAEKLTAPFRTRVGIGLCVPSLTGEIRNPAQAASGSGAEWFHSPDYICSAVIATTREHFLLHGPFPDSFDGYDWWQVALQAKMAEKGLSAAVVPGLTFGHTGSGTYGWGAGAGEGFLANLEHWKSETGMRVEYKRRPTLPCLSPPTECLWSDCFLVSSRAGAEESKSYAPSEEASQVSIVDCAGSAEESKAIFDVACAAYGDRLRFVRAGAPSMSGADAYVNASAQALGAVSGGYARLRDLRDGHAIPAPTAEGKRMRVGGRYLLPSMVTDLHIGQLQHYAVGDTLVMTNVLHALKKKHPHIRLHVHHGWDASVLLKHNPDIAGVMQYSMSDVIPPPEVTDIGWGAGSEDAVLGPFRELGLTDTDRTLRYYVQPSEHEAALALLAEGLPELAGDASPIVIGVQQQGGWKNKSWSHLPQLIEQLLVRGIYVVVFGVQEGRKEEIPMHPRLMTIGQKPLRDVAALIALLDVFIGYDSGLCWIAGAVQTPMVTLWGPLDPLATMMNVGFVNASSIRKMSPADCQRERGTSCRTTHGGSACPFRENGIGGDCLDKITVPEVLSEILDNPKWEMPIGSRVIHG